MLIVCPTCATPNRVPDARLQQEPLCGKCGAPILPAQPVELTDSTIAKVIERSELPVVVDFWAPWCGPCNMMAPQYAQVAAQLHGRAVFAKLDTEANPQNAMRHRIRSIPTLAVFKGGVESARQSGAMMAADLTRWLQQTL
jgi:thioredoxin 2